MIYSIAEKLELAERLLDYLRGSMDREDQLILKAICADIRAQMPQAPSIALAELQRRIADAVTTKTGLGTGLGWETGAMLGIAQEVIGRWPVIRQALERRGAMIEASGTVTARELFRDMHPAQEELFERIDGAIEAAFRIGFEHAVDGGHEASKKLPQLKGTLPIVLYFGNEADRQEMITAVRAYKPMTTIKVPSGKQTED